MKTLQIPEADLQFVGYRVNNLIFEMKDEFLTKEQKEYKLEISIEINSSPSRNFHEVMFQIEVSNLEKTLNIVCVIKGGFMLKKEIDKAHLKECLEKSATAILFPYARMAITNVTTAAGISPLFLPTLNFSDVKISKKRSSQKKPTKRKAAKKKA